jgi:hypothetical protein
VLGDAGISSSWDLLRTLRAEVTLDASLMYLLPGINYPKFIRRYVSQMRERQQKQLQKTKNTRQQLAKICEQIDLPTKLAENAYYEGEYLRRRARRYEGYLSKASQVGMSVFLVLSRAFILAAGAALFILLQQRFHIHDRFGAPWMQELVERIPRFDTLVWLLVAGGALYLAREMSQIRHVLENPEPSRTSGGRR